MTELITIALSTVGIGLCWYCAGVADSTAYDSKAHDIWEGVYDDWKKSFFITPFSSSSASRPQPPFSLSPFTRYHIGTPWDSWHVFQRISRAGTYLVAGTAFAIVGISWWLIPMVACNAVAGLIGFNLGDKWKGSMWMRAIGDWWNK